MGDICSPRAPAGMRVVALPPLAALAAGAGAGASSSRERRARSPRSPPPCGLADVDWDWDCEADAPAACLRGDLCGAGGSWLPWLPCWLPCWLPPPSLGRLRRCASLRCVACLGLGLGVGLGVMPPWERPD